MRNITKTIVNLALIFLLAGCSSNSPKIPSYDGYQLFWHDEFDGEELNEEYWDYQIGDGSPNVGWGNSELQYYKKENVSIRDNKLVITAIREEMRGYHYTSARIRTANKVHFKYGRVEASIKLPDITGMWQHFGCFLKIIIKGSGGHIMEKSTLWKQEEDLTIDIPARSITRMSQETMNIKPLSIY